MKNYNSLVLPLHLEERAGIKRVNEPVVVGVPFPKGAIFDLSLIALTSPFGKQLPLQVQTLAQWPDSSVKWALLDFQASVEANTRTVYQLRPISERLPDLQMQSIFVRDSAEHIVVDTGCATFFLNRRFCRPFDRVLAQETNLIAEEGSSLILTDETGQEYKPYIHDLAIETMGPLRVTIRAQGELQTASHPALARFVVRLSFYASSSLVGMQVTVHNPRAARHPGGLWDLGDGGSLYFKDLSLCLPLRTQHHPRTAWTTQPLQPLKGQTAAHLEIYQDSSGGENWRSTNHVNRFNRVMQTFRGCRVTVDGCLLEERDRATPVLAISDDKGGVAATVDNFWQNFPKALEVRGNELILRLFPRQFNDIFELQGGEQKTHTVYLQFIGPKKEPVNLNWVHDRLIPRATPEWYADTKACSYLSPRNQDQNAECLELVEAAITGPQSFFTRREIIDEYGWRHFGDLYADHEAVGYTGETPLVTHYNNQYDVIYGAIVQYLRSGVKRWFELMRDLAGHVIDIDIYHTHEDRLAYNGGLFWHTDHYLDAKTATHRSYSKVNLKVRNPRFYGGGTSNEHNYTSGLLHYYYLTGDPTAREAVLSLANWVINMDDGSQRPFGSIDRRPTGLCSSTVSRDYHGPGRGAGNSINATLDAYVLTQEEHYLAKSEELICRCIHPRDNIQDRSLDDPEHRWSYLVFLQVLGKYLDLKVDKGDTDYMYAYARASLIHYVEWMRTHEVPYATVLDKVEIPTETWPAQDIRKSVVFLIAAKHAMEPLHTVSRQKAEFFFQACLRDLCSFPTRTLTRPVVLLLTNAYIYSYFQMHSAEAAPQADKQYDFGQPRRFKPQFAEVYWVQKKVAAWAQVIRGIGRRTHDVKRKRQAPSGAHNDSRDELSPTRN
jgi:hypothetical protein